MPTSTVSQDAVAGTRQDSAASPPGYDLFEEVGRGGMGVVYRARDLALDREVAVKLLLDDYAPESSVARRFLDEARITGQLQHPGIPAIYQVGARAGDTPSIFLDELGRGC